MNLRQLSYFVAIAEEHQITAAARRLHITQPPLSHELSSLETELGVKLVDRGSRSVELTDAGKLLYGRACQILAMTSATRHEVESFGRGLSGVLHLGAVSSSGGVVPTTRMLEFTKSYPDVRFELNEGNTFQVIDMLRKGIVDVGIVRTPFPETGLCMRRTATEPMAAVMPLAYVVGADPRAVTLAELSQVPIVLYRRYEPLLRECFAEEGVTPFVSCVNSDARTTCIWADKGFGVGLVPRSILRMMNMGHLVVKDIACERLMTSVAVIWEKDRYLSPIASRFVDMFDERTGSGQPAAAAAGDTPEGAL